MKVLIVAEGPHECEGALLALVERLIRQTTECTTERLANRRIHASHGKGQGYFKKSVRWMLEAASRGYDAIVLLVDEDGVATRRREIKDAQDSPIADIRRALGVAIRTFDAWMLADETALSRVLGSTVNRQKDPEELHEPKQICRQILEASGQALSTSAMYDAVARELTISVLEQRCSQGFAPFAARIRAL